MSIYSDPTATMRQIVEESLAAIVAIIASIDETISQTDTAKSSVGDPGASGQIAQHSNLMALTRANMNTEKTRLEEIIAGWDA